MRSLLTKFKSNNIIDGHQLLLFEYEYKTKIQGVILSIIICIIDNTFLLDFQKKEPTEKMNN